MNILYVENHPAFATTVTQRFLSQHSVTVVPSLSAARQIIPTRSFDMFLVDFDLDDGKGDDLVRELCASGCRTIIIGVSSHEQGNGALIRAGATAVCSKMQFDQIQTVIDSAVKREKERK